MLSFLPISYSLQSQPELEFGNTTDKRPVFGSITRRKLCRVVVIHVLQFMTEGREYQGRQEAEQKVQQIKAQRIGNEIKSVS